jgi:hypothetical protein
MSGSLRENQGVLREHTRKVWGTFREHQGISGKIGVLLRNVPGWFGENSGISQRTFRAHIGSNEGAIMIFGPKLMTN